MPPCLEEYPASSCANAYYATLYVIDGFYRTAAPNPWSMQCWIIKTCFNKKEPLLSFQSTSGLLIDFAEHCLYQELAGPPCWPGTSIWGWASSHRTFPVSSVYYAICLKFSCRSKCVISVYTCSRHIVLYKLPRVNLTRYSLYSLY